MTVSASRAGLWVLPSHQPQELTREASGCCPSLLPRVSRAIYWQVAFPGSELAGHLISLDTGPVVPLFLSPRIPDAGCPLEPQGQSPASSLASLHIVEAPPQR